MLRDVHSILEERRGSGVGSRRVFTCACGKVQAGNSIKSVLSRPVQHYLEGV